MKTDEVVDALAALAQPSRLETYRLLVRRGPQGVAAGEIADRLAIPPTTLSFHLAHLTRAGLARARRAGRSILYAADYERARALVAYLMENCCAEEAWAPVRLERKNDGSEERRPRRRP